MKINIEYSSFLDWNYIAKNDRESEKKSSTFCLFTDRKYIWTSNMETDLVPTHKIEITDMVFPYLPSDQYRDNYWVNTFDNKLCKALEEWQKEQGDGI